MTEFYPWLVTLGALIGMLWLGLVEQEPKRSGTSIPPVSRIDMGITSLVGGFLGARLGFVLVHLNYYSIHSDEIINYWDGGLNWAGGTVGALVGLGIYAGLRRHSFWRLVDIVAIPTVIFAFSAWFGCLLDRCAFGKPADFGFLTPFLPNNLGEQLHRWPVQGAGAIFALLTLLILINLRPKNLPGGVFGTLSLVLISGTNFLLSFFRGDHVPILNGFRWDGIVSLSLFILSLIAFALRMNKPNLKKP